MDYNKMKVNDLKAELAARNLDTKGVKAVLVERLKEFIENEESGELNAETPSVAAAKKLDVGTPGQSTPVRRSRRRSMTRSPSPTRTEVTPLESVSEEAEQAESTDPSSARKKRRTRSITKSPSPTRTTEVKRLEVLEEEPDVADKASQPTTPKKQPEADNNVDKNQVTPKKSETTPTKQAASPAVTPAKTTPAQPAKTTPKQSETPKSVTTPVATSAKTPAAQPTGQDTPKKSTSEAQPDATKDSKTPAKDDATKTGETDNKNDATNDNQNADEASKAVKRKSSSPMKDSANKTPRPAKPVQTDIEFVAEENEPEIDNSKFLLSWFDSDLNLEIDPKTFDSAKPVSNGALALLWAGVRANMGVTKGKVAFEVILTKTNDMRKVTEEPVTSEFRVGWSTADTNLQLGEAKHSFAYGSTGSKGTDSKFSDYGAEYKINDVIGVYLDLESTPCKIEYTVNNVSQGTAFEFEKSELEGKAMFPHICSRNIAFKVNFGQLERSLLNDRPKPKKVKKDVKKPEKQAETSKDGETKPAETEKPAEAEKPADTEKSEKAAEAEKPTETAKSEEGDKATAQAEDKPTEKANDEEKVDEKDAQKEEETVEPEVLTINPEYIYVAQSPKENLVLGACRPESRKECELIFLIGMPASGKTHWVTNYLKEHADKKVTVLSVHSLLDQMKLAGEPRKPGNTKKWSRLVDQLSKSLNTLGEIAAKRRKNFIFDQTNVFPSEQKRKLRGFGEFAARKAVIVVPDEEEHERRIKQKSEVFGTEVTESHLNVMKAHFHIPPKELNWFTEVTYTDLDAEKAAERMKALNEFGQKKLPQGFKRNPQQQRRGANNNQRWNQGNKRYSGVQQYHQGGYNQQQQRYNSTQQYSQNRNYRGGYGRPNAGGYTGGRYGSNNDWTRGRYDNRYNNRGYQNNQAQRYGGNYNRGYNTGSAWNQQNTNCWSYGGGNQGNDSQQWYSWWQSNLKNLLQQQGGSGGDSNSQQQYWSQYAQQPNYGNYQHSKFQGSGSSSKNK